jgi:hypothetical protein
MKQITDKMLKLSWNRVKTGYGVHPASYPIGTSGFFPGDKASGA